MDTVKYRVCCVGVVNIEVWLREIRAPFLLLAPITFSVGASAAFIDGHFDLLFLILGLIGVTLAHISINVMNEYFDYRSGLDFKTQRTPFSGGSGVLTSGELEPETVFRFALVCMLIGGSMGVYIAFNSTWLVLPVVAVALLTIYLYTPLFAKMYLGEIITGINFGPLVSIGGYLSLAGTYGPKSLYSGIVPGILIGTLLYLNEFPDIEADKSVGRRNFVIALGLEKAAYGYGMLIASVYLWVLYCAVIGLLPWTIMVTYLTLPIGFKAVKGVIDNKGKIPDILPFMGENVNLTLSMTALTSIGLLISLFI